MGSGFFGGRSSGQYNSAGYSGGAAPGSSSLGGNNLVRGREFGPIAALAPNSTIGKAMLNDPVSSFLFGKPRQVNPTAGPYAGTAPSLALANGGYALTSSGQPGYAGNPGQSAQLTATFGGQPAGATPTPAARPVMGAGGSLFAGSKF